MTTATSKHHAIFQLEPRHVVRIVRAALGTLALRIDHNGSTWAGCPRGTLQAATVRIRVV